MSTSVAFGSMTPASVASSPNKFTVTRTTAVASKKRRLVADRRDLNMAQQRKSARVEIAKLHHASLTVDYQQTQSSRLRHHEFLACILHEVQHYHLQHHGVMIPYRAMEILAEHISEEMEDVEVDNYTHCLSYLAQHRLYSPDFPAKARKIVAAENAAEMSSSSAGLSTTDDCMDSSLATFRTA